MTTSPPGNHREARIALMQGGSGTEPEPGTGTVGTVFPETD